MRGKGAATVTEAMRSLVLLVVLRPSPLAGAGPVMMTLVPLARWRVILRGWRAQLLLRGLVMATRAPLLPLGLLLAESLEGALELSFQGRVVGPAHHVLRHTIIKTSN